MPGTLIPVDLVKWLPGISRYDEMWMKSVGPKMASFLVLSHILFKSNTSFICIILLAELLTAE